MFSNATGQEPLPKTWKTGETVPGTLYVEGVSPGIVELRLEYDKNPQGQNNSLFKCEDRVGGALPIVLDANANNSSRSERHVYEQRGD